MMEDWVECTLGEVGEIFSGGTPKTKVPEYWGGNIGWISPADLSLHKAKTIENGRKNITELGLNNSSAKLLPKGSILFSSRAPIGYVVIAGEELATNQGFKSIYPFNVIDKDYIYHYLKSSKGLAEKRASGTTFKEISKKVFSELPFPLPPLPIQRAIVSKLESLFSSLDSGIADLKKAQAQLKVYRQAVLKKAFEGEFTKAWREKQTDLPSAEALRKQIAEERQRHYQNELEKWEKDVAKWEAEGKVGKKPRKLKSLNKIETFSSEELKKLPLLPRKWKWIKSGKLFKYVTSGSRGWAKYYADEGGIFIRITNLNFDTLDLDLTEGNLKFVNPPKGSEGSRTIVKEGDFLFSITGYLGMFAICPKLEEAYVNQHISLARPIGINNQKFLGYWIISKSGGNLFLNKRSKGATKAGLGLNDINQFPVPLVPLKEQHQIVSEIESRLSVCDSLEESIDVGLKKAEALRQSLLKKAFSGQLLTESEIEACKQEADYEPASVLLERIKAEKA
ncbi:MAG: restriction endonuclease subunit S [Bacteroidota bacterium]